MDLISIGIVAEDGREYFAISNEYDYDEKFDEITFIFTKLYSEQSSEIKAITDKTNFHKKVGKDNKQIAEEVKAFCEVQGKEWKSSKIYGYACDHQWVSFISLFGGEEKLPKGMQRYSNNLQVAEEELINKEKSLFWNHCPVWIIQPNALAFAKWNFEYYKFIEKMQAPPKYIPAVTIFDNDVYQANYTENVFVNVSCRIGKALLAVGDEIEFECDDKIADNYTNKAKVVSKNSEGFIIQPADSTKLIGISSDKGFSSGGKFVSPKGIRDFGGTKPLP
jgi:hypothetical protein